MRPCLLTAEVLVMSFFQLLSVSLQITCFQSASYAYAAATGVVHFLPPKAVAAVVTTVSWLLLPLLLRTKGKAAIKSTFPQVDLE